MLELGAGAGRNTLRYTGFERVVLVDYSRSQLQQAQARLGNVPKYVYVAADIYRLPFVAGLFDAATMIRTLHHMADAPKALAQVHAVLGPRAAFILEFANKRNFKAIARFALGRQEWNPFDPEPVEFAKLNFDFHPRTVRIWLESLRFDVQRTLTVSHFRAGLLKRAVPTSLLVWLDSLFQWTGGLWQYTPSVFVKAVALGGSQPAHPRSELDYFKCPNCGQTPLTDAGGSLDCPQCGSRWAKSDGIYDFREPSNI
jgi:SAM-dependent methyltransferase